MRVRKTLAAAFLLLAAAMAPELVWAGAHFHHNGHGLEADSIRDLAEVLVHGHRHREGTPHHEHNLLPSPPIRQEAPRSLQVSGAALPEAPQGEPHSLSRTSSAWQLPWRAGSSPPILHLLCTLLI